MSSFLGPLAALGSSFTWAFASTRYAQVSREIGSTRVNLARALCVAPIYTALAMAMDGDGALASVTRTQAGWLFVSVLCSYVVADNLFFAAARRLGITTALSLASTYPLWAALTGTLFYHERFGLLRALGTGLSVGGVILLVRLSRDVRAEGYPARVDRLGLVLAFATSVLWAGNSVSVKLGSEGLSVWQANAVRYGMAVIMLAIPVISGRDRSPRRGPRGGWAVLMPAIVSDALLGSLLYVYGLGHTDLAVGSTLSSLSPLASVPIAILVGEEKWSTARLRAVALTTVGVVILISA